MMHTSPTVAAPDAKVVKHNVETALAEDVGTGDITAALITSGSAVTGHVITREQGILCGQAWVDAVFATLDAAVTIEWHYRDSDAISPGDTLFTATGRPASLLTGERTALNFLQLLSGTATICKRYADRVAGTGVRLLDTRKTIPGLREAQKYAVRCGGCSNHRMGLYDAFLIKENHITACGGIAAAVKAARAFASGKLVEVEVENLAQLEAAIAANCDRIMLDNFALPQIAKAVDIASGAVALEVSGNVTETTLLPLAQSGVDFISIGALTKDCSAMDLSMRLVE